MNVFFDIETAPDTPRIKAGLKPWPDYNQDECKLGNLKDEQKILDKLADHKAKWQQGKIDQLKDAVSKAALCPSTGRILCIQYAIEDGPVVVIAEKTEAETLNVFHAVAGSVNDKLINWTGSNKGGNFDKNFILRRSWAHKLGGLYLGEWKDAAKDFLRDADWGTYYSLENAARELGIKVESTGEVTGKNFHEHWITNREAALKYARQDVELVRSIWKRMRGAAS